MKSKQKNMIALVAAIVGMTTVWGQGAYAADSMPGMDHNSMENAPASPEMKSMDRATSGGENDTSMQGGAAPADARDPHAYSDDYDFGPIAPPVMADQAYMGGILVNRLERVRTSDNAFTMYDLMAKFGKDYDKLVLKAEGEASGGKLRDARTELLWGHAVASFWDMQLGIRHDGGVGANRGWLAFGVQGLAPYWFDIEATAYAGDNGRSALRLGAEYELLFTQKFILQPRAEINLYGKSDPARDIGSGLSDVQAGLRLRYEFTRQFAPYIGLEWANKYAGTADLVRLSGEPTHQSRMVAGLRFWF